MHILHHSPHHRLLRSIAGIGCAAAAAICLLFPACKPKGVQTSDGELVEAPTADEVEAMTAPYVSGHFEDYTDGFLSVRDKTPAYRKQIVALMKQRHRQEAQERGGIQFERIVSIQQSVVHPRYAEAFLIRSFRNGTREQVGQPLVFHNGRWWLR